MNDRERLAGEAMRRAGIDPAWWPNSSDAVIGMGVLIERIEALEAAIIAAGYPLRFREGGLIDPKGHKGVAS